MIPTKTHDGTREGSLDGYEIEMDLDLSPEGRAHLISLVTDLYSDKELACIREYSTNARDAHIESGNSGPIRVSTPTSLSPYLIIQDFGTGLSVEELKRVYSLYGASTKRGTNAVNGMLGLGCKSALTYSSQFLIEAVKAGIRTQAAVTRNENGVGVIEVVDTSVTDLPNGVTIKIPAKEGNRFERKVMEFFYYWQPGTVLVNGKEPASLLNDSTHTKINDNVFVIEGDYNKSSNTDIIVMGGVAYPTTDKPFTAAVSNNRNYYTWTVVFAEMGEVAFAPSREALMDSKNTQDTIARIQGEIKAGIKASIDKQLKSATSHADAFRLWNGWSNLLGSGGLPKMTYKGTDFVQTVTVRHAMMRAGTGRYNSSTGERAWAGGTDNAIALTALLSPDTLIFTGYTNTEAPTANSKRKVMHYISQLTDKPKTALFFDTLPGAPWTDGVTTHDWADVAAIKFASTGGQGGRTGTIPILLWTPAQQRWIETTQLDSTKPIAYFSTTDEMAPLAYQISGVLPDVQMVQLGANRWTKFKRENPSAMHLREWRQKEYRKALMAVMTDDAKLYASYCSSYRQAAVALAGKTDDPIFSKLASMKVDSALVSAYNEAMNQTTKHDFRTDYPLIGYDHNHKHAALYINAVYATKGN